jgi:hypothetical protein
MLSGRVIVKKFAFLSIRSRQAFGSPKLEAAIILPDRLEVPVEVVPAASQVSGGGFLLQYVTSPHCTLCFSYEYNTVQYKYIILYWVKRVLYIYTYTKIMKPPYIYGLIPMPMP